MKVLILATGKIEEHNESYGARLIEQARAVLAPEKKTETGRRGASAPTQNRRREQHQRVGHGGLDPLTEASERSL